LKYRSFYRAAWLMTASKQLSKYKSDGTEVALNQQVNTDFTIGRGMRIMNLVKVFFVCVRESHQHL
jgi:hypothetical protein